ncbi:MAG: ATP-binding protein [Deltaproteobacteria bacterium]|nr:ATP-binding protein [Deltaproteobacteria bacterium]
MQKRPKLIVLTGGPGAGKTTVLDTAKHMFFKKALVLHEAASMIYNGGFLRSSTPMAIQAAQRAIYYIQREQERIIEKDHTNLVGLCDRGALDGLAYWPDSKEDFFKSLGTTEAEELDRYEAIIHLRTPTEELGYSRKNSARTETVDEAMKLDQRTFDAWKNHPKHHVVDSRQDFLHKMEEVIGIISKYI